MNTPHDPHSKIGLIAALIIGCVALAVLATLLLFKSGATYGPPGTNPFFFSTPSPIPTATLLPSPSMFPIFTPTTTPLIVSPIIPIFTPTSTPVILTTPLITPTPTPTPTPLIPSPPGGPHTVTIVDLGVSQTFGGSTGGIITLTPGTATTVYIQGSVSHTPNPPACSSVQVSYAGIVVTPSCPSTPGFQIPASIQYNAACAGIPAGNQTSWSASITATDTDSAASVTGIATAVVQC